MGIEGIILSQEKKDEKIISQLKKSNLDIYIYGCGNSGIAVYDYLKKYNVFIRAFVVDEEYYFNNNYNGISIRRISDIALGNEKVNIVIGFSDYWRGISRAKKIQNVNNIFCISNPHLYLQKYSLDRKFYEENADKFEESLEFFEDELSKKIMVAYLNTRINQDYKFLMPYSGCKTYFNREIVNLFDNECYVDCGAYNGDSINQFIDSVTGYRKIYAFEPDIENYIKLEQAYLENKNICLFNIGVWKAKDKIKVSKEGKQELTINQDINTQKIIQVDALDNILDKEKVTLLKLNIQGAEEEALWGAKNILRQCEPRLAVAIFMKPDSLIRIPYAIKKINPRYKLFLRCEDPFFARVILYARVENLERSVLHG